MDYRATENGTYSRVKVNSLNVKILFYFLNQP